MIQLLKPINPEFEAYVAKLKNNGVRVNYYGTDAADELRALFAMGVDFPLVNELGKSMKVARALGIEPVIPVYADGP